MAIAEHSEESVGTNPFSSSPSSASSSSPSFLFQSISSECDGQRKSCRHSLETAKIPLELDPLLQHLPQCKRRRFRPRMLSSTRESVTTVSRTAPSCGHLPPHQYTSEEQWEDRTPETRPRRYHKFPFFLHHPQLNSLTLHLAVVLIVTTIFACFPSPVGSSTSTSPSPNENEKLVCVEGFSQAFPGATFPRGDIMLQEGGTLEVACKLNLTHPSIQGYNASNVEFKFTKADIPQENVLISVVNETTAVVRVKNMTASNPFLQCLVRKENGDVQPVCQNQIDVGYPPLKVEDFRCVAREWKSLNCTWKLPSNPIPTKYTLSKLWNKRWPIACPNTTATATSCTWGARTEPHYFQNLDPIQLLLNGTNALAPSGVTWEFRFSLGTIVIPEKPELFIKKLNSGNQYMVNWTFPNYENFKPGLEHQLKICWEYEAKCNVSKFPTKPINGRMTPFYVKTITLPHAYSKYTISVRLRSPIANDSEEFWSDPDSKDIVTDSRAPDFPPETDIGSFETVVKNHNFRDVHIYWRSIPDQLKNGPGFKYEILVYEDEREIGIKPQVITDSYAKFPNLSSENSYRFTISAVNSLGRSRNASEITVPSIDRIPEGPKSVSKIDFTNGSFEISWKRPDRYNGIHSYTVFRCGSKKPRPYPCEGRLEWDRVDASTYETNHKFYDLVSHQTDHLYQFAVSANSDQFGSGVVWATCTLFHGKVPGKLKTVRYENPTEDEILIKWDLECSYQAGDIEGFKIIYCQVEKYPAERCKDDETVVAVAGANTTTYKLQKLKPFSVYKIYVLILAAAGQSQRSDPVYARTSEGAPSHVITASVSSVTNKSAKLHIESPTEWNGLLREYKVYYSSRAEPSEKELRVPLQVSNDTKDFIEEVTLENLASHSNYSVYIVSCTTKCSERSEPFFFETDIGQTNLRKTPEIYFDAGEVGVKWNMPEVWGGSIDHFEVQLKRDGTIVSSKYMEPFNIDHQKFATSTSETCESTTSFSAQVRAVTKLPDGTVLFGDWSPEGSGSCTGRTSWLVWLILAFVAALGVVIVGYLSIRLYHYFKRNDVAIKLPPGLNAELNGFAHKPPPRSRSSDNGFGKETYAYPLQPTSNHTEESKDFLPSSELNDGEAEESLIEKPFCPSPTNPLLGGLDFSCTSDCNNMDDDENDIRLTEFTNIHENGCSSPTYKKLGVLSNGSAVSVKPIPGPSSRSTPSTRSELDEFSSGSPSHTISQISNHHPTIAQNARGEPSASNGINRTVPDVLSSSPSSTTSLNSSPAAADPTPPSPPAPVPAAPQASSYVQWATLVPDMKTGEAGNVLDNGNRQAYCQVGILLDS